MKWLGAALAALMVASSALADNDVLIVKCATSATNGYTSIRAAQLVEEILTARGSTWAEVNIQAMSTANLKAGNLVLGNTTYHYDAVVVVGFDNNLASTPRALTLMANWPTVPTALIASYTNDADGWTQSSSCSTGVQGHLVGRDVRYNYYAAYMTGTPYVFMSPSSGGYFHLNPAAVPPGIFRPIVQDGPTQASRTPLGSAATVFNANAQQPDSVGFNASDSLLIWARYGPTGNTVPLVMCAAGQNPGLVKMTLAMLDSASGGAVFDDASKRTRKIMLWVGGAFSRCRWDSIAASGARTFYNHGTFCAADSCDSVNVKAGIDSLNSLGIKYTVGVNADSIATYPSELAWWRNANAKYGIEASYSAPVASGAASQTHPFDPLGHVRTRRMMEPPNSVVPYAYSATDTSSYALLCSLRGLIEAQWPGRFAKAIHPSYDDYSPVGDDRLSSKQTRDTLNYILRGSGIVAVIINPTQQQGNVGRGTDPAVGAITSGTDPWGFDPVTRTEAVYATPGPIGTSAVRIGKIRFLPCRSEFVNAKLGWIGGHDIKGEWVRGLNEGDSWYSDWPTLAGSTFYKHDFMTSTPVLYVPVGLLGGAGVGPAVVRPGYWPIKWVENERKAVNALMIPGRQLDQWVWPEEFP